MSDDLKQEAATFARAHPASILATVDGDAPWMRVMHAVKIEDNLTIWFACGASSNKVRQTRANPKVEVAFWESPRDLVVSGTAEIVADAETRHAMWQEEWQQYFPEGKDDPEYCLLRITPTQALYRDVEQTGFMPNSVL